MKKPSPRTQLIFGVVVSVVFLAYALRGLDLRDLGAKLAQAELSWSLPLLLVLLAAAFWVRAWRWSLILRPTERVSTREAFPATMIGFMGNNIYPAHLGEFLRAYIFCKQRGLPFTLVFSTLVVERILDLFTILGCLFGAIPFLPEGKLPDLIVQGAPIAAAVTAAGALGLAPFVLWPARALGVLRRVLAILPEGLAGKLMAMAESGALGLAVARSPRLLAACLFASVLHWSIYGVLAVISMRALGVSLTAPQALFLQGATALAVIIPASPGFFGVVQAAFITALFPFFKTGIAEQDRAVRATIIAGSFYYHLSQYVPVTLVGLYFLRVLGVDMKAARAAREEVEAEGHIPRPDDAALPRGDGPDSSSQAIALETES